MRPVAPDEGFRLLTECVEKDIVGCYRALDRAVSEPRSTRCQVVAPIEHTGAQPHKIEWFAGSRRFVD